MPTPELSCGGADSRTESRPYLGGKPAVGPTPELSRGGADSRTESRACPMLQGEVVAAVMAVGAKVPTPVLSCEGAHTRLSGDFFGIEGVDAADCVVPRKDGGWGGWSQQSGQTFLFRRSKWGKLTHFFPMTFWIVFAVV